MADTYHSRIVEVVPAADGAMQSFSIQPTLSNNPSSGTVGGRFTPVVDEGTSTGTTSVTSSTPSICSVNQKGSVSYLAAGTCSLISHVAATQTTIGSGLNSPYGVAVDASGNVYVADYNNNRVQKVTPTGTQTTIGSGFSNPVGVAVDASGNVYVADVGNNQLEKVTTTGTQTTIGSGFSLPYGVAVDASGNVYVADCNNNQVEKITPTGTQTTIGSGFSNPVGVAVDASDNVYVAERGNNQVEKVTPTGTQTTIGSGFSNPVGVAVDASGTVYVADHDNNHVEKITPTGSQTTIGSGFNHPTGVAVDASGTFYVADTTNNRVEQVAPAVDGAAQSFSVAPCAPGAPSHVKAKSRGARVTISWHAPSSDGGDPITTYQAKASPGGKSCKTSGLSCTISGLDPRKKYTVSIKAKNALGYGPAVTKRKVTG